MKFGKIDIRGGLFSKRNPPKDAEKPSTDFPELVRNRIILTLEQSDCTATIDGTTDKIQFNPYAYDAILSDVAIALQREYGGLMRRTTGQINHDPRLEHFYACNSEQMIDFLLMFFSHEDFGSQAAVEEINRIMRESNIGFVFTDFVVRAVEDINSRGNTYTRHDITRPEVVVKNDEYVYAKIVKPCLAVLSKPIWKQANDELLKAHNHFRHGSFEDSLTNMSAAYESVLKVICTKKKWKFNTNTDTCGKLVDILKINNLFPAFYMDLMKMPGTIRNRLGSAHGKGTPPEHTADIEFVEHALQITSSNIIFLVTLARMG